MNANYIMGCDVSRSKDSSILCYKGFYGSIEYSDEDKMYYGELLYINDLVNYASKELSTIQSEFIKAVDDYLLFGRKWLNNWIEN
ncbi:hypothetical protein [Anaerovorax sp. IOR16]|uniref:hypothetical protein n=1 Tax=Anaerovorax sp. IOR16 TaxID=2773458 RepID=UPI0019D1CF9E|nr:hypothetical protein [Anaerovorax sp. IOR16]